MLHNLLMSGFMSYSWSNRLCHTVFLFFSDTVLIPFSFNQKWCRVLKPTCFREGVQGKRRITQLLTIRKRISSMWNCKSQSCVRLFCLCNNFTPAERLERFLQWALHKMVLHLTFSVSGALCTCPLERLTKIWSPKTMWLIQSSDS